MTTLTTGRPPATREGIAAFARRAGAPLVLVLVLLVGTTAFGSSFAGPPW